MTLRSFFPSDISRGVISGSACNFNNPRNECLINHQYRNNQNTCGCPWWSAEVNGIPDIINSQLLFSEQLSWCTSCYNVEESERPNFSNNCRHTKASPSWPWTVQESTSDKYGVDGFNVLLYFRPQQRWGWARFIRHNDTKFLLQGSVDNMRFCNSLFKMNGGKYLKPWQWLIILEAIRKQPCSRDFSLIQLLLKT